jgi:hypothetical protein
MAQQHVWRSPTTIPRDGSPILLLMADWDVFGCRHGREIESAVDAPCYWYTLDWSDACVADDAENRKKFVGWLPFPLIADPHPNPEHSS